MDNLYAELGKVYLEMEQHQQRIQQLMQIKQSILEALQAEIKKNETSANVAVVD